MGKKMFYNEENFENYLEDNNYEPIFKGSEALVYTNGTKILKRFFNYKFEDDYEIVTQSLLHDLDQSTYVAFDSLCMVNNYVVAGIHEYIPGVELVRGIQKIDLDKLGSFVKKVYDDTKIISDNGIYGRDFQTFNTIINDDGIYFIDTTRFFKGQKNKFAYSDNAKKSMKLIIDDLFFMLSPNKDEILKLVDSYLLELLNNYESIDQLLPIIKHEYSRYFDCEIHSIEDIAYKLNEKRQ